MEVAYLKVCLHTTTTSLVEVVVYFLWFRCGGKKSALMTTIASTTTLPCLIMSQGAVGSICSGCSLLSWVLSLSEHIDSLNCIC
jgi:hypothetical protein